MAAIIQIKNVTKTFVGRDNTVEALKGINNIKDFKVSISFFDAWSGSDKKRLKTKPDVLIS